MHWQLAKHGVLAGDDAYGTAHRGAYLFALLGALLLSLGIYYGGTALGWESSVRISTALSLGIIVVHFYYRIRVCRPANWLAPDLAYIVFYAMFNLAYLTLWLFGILPTHELVFPAPLLYPKTMLVITLGLIGFIIGYELAAGDRVKHRRRDVVETPTQLWIGVGLAVMTLALGIHLYYILRVGLTTFVFGGYMVAAGMSRYVSEVRFWALVPHTFCLGFAIYLVSVARIHGRLFSGKLGIGLFILYVSLAFFEGDRGPVVQTGIVLLLVRHYLVKPIRPKGLLLLFAGAMFLFSAVAVVRNVTAFNPSEMVQEYEYARQSGLVRWYSAFAEMGSSVRTVNHTVSLVPGSSPYWHGKSYLLSLARVVPLLQGKIWPYIGVTSPSLWLTFIILGPGTNTGVGFSLPAEGYLNFGLAGAFFQMAVIGFGLRRLYLAVVRSRSPVVTTTFFASIPFILVAVRGETNLFIAPIIHAAVAAWIVKMLCGVGWEVNPFSDGVEQPEDAAEPA